MKNHFNLFTKNTQSGMITHQSATVLDCKAQSPVKTKSHPLQFRRCRANLQVIAPCFLLGFLLPLFHLAAEDFKKQYDALAGDHSQTDSVRLHRLFDIEWERGLQESPEGATSLGDTRFDDRWTDLSEAAIEARKVESEWPLTVLKSIDRSKLSTADQLNYDLYRRDVELGIEGNRYPGELLQIGQLGGIQQSVAQVLTQMHTDSVKAYENILARLRAVPVAMDQHIALLKRGLALKVTPPKITLRAVPDQILNVIPEDPMQSALLRPFKEFPEQIPAADRERLRTAAIQIYKEQLVPSYKKLYDFITNEYLPGARQSIAWTELPDGIDWYALNVRQSTTTRMSPKEIHELGLAEVKRIHSEMEKLMTETGFKGSFTEFLKFLRTDPRFFYSTAEELLAGYRDIAKRIDPELSKQFRKLPRLTYGIKAVPDYSEKSAPGAYYESGSEKAGRPGWFVANTCNLKGRPKWQMETLTLHEAVPGHHLQISLAQEMANVPEFRKYNGYTAYTEGWALYCESLGSGLGLYKDPYSKFGQLKFEMWRAVRLVVDTGMHAFGWNRKQAIDYMMQNTGDDEFNATVEIDRYLVMPAQALAYKIGQLKIRALRTSAEQELGSQFDVRAFHDALLENGSLPLDLLEAGMKEWVAAQKGN